MGGKLFRDKFFLLYRQGCTFKQPWGWVGKPPIFIPGARITGFSKIMPGFLSLLPQE